MSSVDKFTRLVLMGLGYEGDDDARSLFTILKKAVDAVQTNITYHDTIVSQIEKIQFVLPKLSTRLQRFQEDVDRFMLLADNLHRVYYDEKPRSQDEMLAAQKEMTEIFKALLVDSFPLLDSNPAMLGTAEVRRQKYNLLVVVYPRAYVRTKERLILYMNFAGNQASIPAEVLAYWKQHEKKCFTVEQWAALYKELVDRLPE